jgi:hypothetical protein
VTSDHAIYLDGEPQNLAAAAADALEWLCFWEKYLITKQIEHGTEWGKARINLGAATRTLRQFLPDEKAAFYKTHMRSGAIVEVIVSSPPKENL